jgi:hypothetical protein
MGFLFCDFFWIRHHHRRRHNRVDVENLRLIVTILVIAAAPICAQAQKLTLEGDQGGRAKGPQKIIFPN